VEDGGWRAEGGGCRAEGGGWRKWKSGGVDGHGREERGRRESLEEGEIGRAEGRGSNTIDHLLRNNVEIELGRQKLSENLANGNEISIVSKNFVPWIPTIAEIPEIKSLKVLNISVFGLEELPHGISELQNLENLNLEGNALRSVCWEDRGGRREEEGRGKREEGRGKREEGRGKREEGRGKREEGRGKREEERGKRKEGRGKREEGRAREKVEEGGV
jgi:hypothetical protein